MASFYRWEVSDTYNIYPKSKLQGKNPSESNKIRMLHEIRPFILTQAENPNSKD